MSRLPFILAFLEKSEREFTLLSSLFRVPSSRSLESIETLPALDLMKEMIFEYFLPRESHRVETVFLDRATPGQSSLSHEFW